MTVGKLKRLLEQLPDDMLVAGIYDDECVKYSTLRRLCLVPVEKKCENIYWKNPNRKKKILVLKF